MGLFKGALPRGLHSGAEKELGDELRCFVSRCWVMLGWTWRPLAKVILSPCISSCFSQLARLSIQVSLSLLRGLGGALWLGAFEWTKLLLWPRGEQSASLLHDNLFQGA